MKEKINSIKWEAVLTIFIGLTSVFVAIKANQISKLQAEIARNSILPTITVSETVEAREGVGWEESSVIEISNLSGKMNNYQADVISFLSCGYFSSETADYIKAEVPIQNYYLLNLREASAVGVIERKDAVGNYVKIKNLQKAISKFNAENDEGKSIDPYIQTFLKISYTDLLNEQQVIFYSLDPISIKIIDSEFGQIQFDKYTALCNRNIKIVTNRFDEITVAEVLDSIEQIICLDDLHLKKTEIGTLERNSMELFNMPIVSTIIGAVIGMVGSLLGGWYTANYDRRAQETFAASALLNDLKSIERYLKSERSSVNLRYSNNWQDMVAKCSFLINEEITLVYRIYDEAYNYNYWYRQKERTGAVRKEEIEYYKSLQTFIFDRSKGYTNFEKYSSGYEKLIQTLTDKIKK